MFVIKLRPHHLKPVLCGAFDGSDNQSVEQTIAKTFKDPTEIIDESHMAYWKYAYGIKFAKHLLKIQQRIRKNPQGVLVKIVPSLDDVCKKCARRKKRISCKAVESPPRGLRIGGVYSVEEIFLQIIEDKASNPQVDQG